jgi:arylsulfatase A-like enzyme
VRALLATLVATLVAVGCSRPPEPQPHLLLISVDTLRRDALRAYSAEAGPLPTLDALAAASARFEHAVSPAGWTLPAHGSLMTGVYPHRHGGVHRLTALSTDQPMLAQRLAAAGYDTAAFTDGGFVHARYGFARGFARYDGHSTAAEPAPSWLPRGGRPPRVRAVEPFGRAIAHLEHRDDPRPLFFFVHTYALHDYFQERPEVRHALGRVEREPADGPAAGRPPRGAQAAERGGRQTDTALEEAPPGADRRPGSILANPLARANLRCLLGDEACDAARWSRLRALYRAELELLDGELGRLLATARRELAGRPLWVVLVSDHGEGFSPDGPRHHGGDLHPSLLSVPLLISGPGAQPAAVPARVSLVDVAPTLLELAGLEPPAGLDGISLASLLAGGRVARRADHDLARRDLVAEEHNYWWSDGRRRASKEVRSTPLAAALWRGDWWYVRSIGGESVLPWPAGSAAGSEGGAAPRPPLDELRRATRRWLTTRAAATERRATDRELDAQLRSLGYGGGP